MAAAEPIISWYWGKPFMWSKRPADTGFWSMFGTPPVVALITDGVLQNGLERHQSSVAKKAQLASCPAGNPQVQLLFSQGLATRLTSIYTFDICLFFARIDGITWGKYVPSWLWSSLKFLNEEREKVGDTLSDNMTMPIACLSLSDHYHERNSTMPYMFLLDGHEKRRKQWDWNADCISLVLQSLSQRER